MSYRYWTNHEIKKLSDLWGSKPYQEIAKDLGRSEASVLKKANKLKLQSMRTVQAKHSLVEIKELIDFGYHPTQIAKDLNTSTKSVYNTVRDRLPKSYYNRLKTNVRMYNREIGQLTPVYRKGKSYDS